MVKMRIPIREQLACLVLLASLIGLAVIAIATWYTNYHFVLGLRSDRLSFTASLKAARLASNLSLIRILVKQAANRLAPQTALSRYYQGNPPDTLWARTAEDYDAIFSGSENDRVALQARIYSRNSSDSVLFQRTASSATDVQLPYSNSNGQPATMGNAESGFIPELYPKFTVRAIPINSTFNMYQAEYNGRVIDNTSFLLSGPYRVNDSFSLCSITLPIINNTSSIDNLGWLTIVLDAALITDPLNDLDGLGRTGLTLLVGPNNSTNNFPKGSLYNEQGAAAREGTEVRFVVAPTNRKDVSRHKKSINATVTTQFDWARFSAVRRGFTQDAGTTNNAGSMISTKNEDGQNVAVGHALVKSPLVDWMVLVEQSHNEVWSPIRNLRKVLLACVFGTMGAMILLAYPIAHYASQPIRRLREATRKTVSPHLYGEDAMSFQHDGGNDDADGEVARKEGWLGQVVHYRRNHKASHAEKKEAARRKKFRIPGKVKDRKHFIHDELTDLTTTFNEMADELFIQYDKLEERVAQRTAELEQSKVAAEAANESKTLFIANISHELKTPLNGILGMCAVCMSEDDPVRLRRSLGIIYKSGDLLLNLLTDLLTFSKNQVGQHLSLDEKEFRLRDISTQVLAIFEKQAKEGGINLSVKFEGPYDANLGEDGRPNERGNLGPFGLGRLKDMILYGDQHRILQVVINLVSNSLKFTPQGGSVVLSIRCSGQAMMVESRKTSMRSRQSSMRNFKSRMASIDSEVGSSSAATPTPVIHGTANVINPMDKAQTYAQVMHDERSPAPPPGRWLSFEFEVEDTGPGIPEHLHSKIFEPFVQGDLGLSKKFGGTGLGLSICSQLAGLMKGSVSLKSEMGHGSIFTMSIPLKHITSRADSTASSIAGASISRHSVSLDEQRGRPEDATSNRSIHSVQSASAAANSAAVGPVAFDVDSQPRLVGLSQPFFASSAPMESPGSQVAAMKRVEADVAQREGKIRVLVAEDNKTNQEVVLRMLKLEDVYDVTIAKDGQEAFDKVKESMERHQPFNLIFMDVQMPNLDGLESTRLIRESGFSSPIVALTAYSEESNVKKCLESGMDFFLSKPIRRPALKHVLKTYCPTILEEENDQHTRPETKAPKPKKSTKRPSKSKPADPAPFSLVPQNEHRDQSPAVSPGAVPVASPLI